jgi:hypothetical protein
VWTPKLQNNINGLITGQCQMLACTVTFDYRPTPPRGHGNCSPRMSVNNPRKFLRAVHTSGNLQGFIRCSEGKERLVVSTVELNKEPNKIRRIERQGVSQDDDRFEMTICFYANFRGLVIHPHLSESRHGTRISDAEVIQTVSRVRSTSATSKKQIFPCMNYDTYTCPTRKEDLAALGSVLPPPSA